MLSSQSDSSFGLAPHSFSNPPATHQCARRGYDDEANETTLKW